MNKRKSGLITLVLLDILLVVIGTALLIVAHKNPQRLLLHDLSRDIGIAFIVSSLVTIAYETYARTRFDLAKISALLDTVYGSGIPPRVWERIKETLLKREVMRQNAVIHLGVLRDENIDADNLVLDVDLSYDLANLQSKAAEYLVVHGLDEHITAHNLPRFMYASIGPRSEVITDSRSWSTTDELLSVANGSLTLKVLLRPNSEDAAVPLRIRRREVRECPGSYYLIMTEVTDGVTVYLDECPADVDVEVAIRPSEAFRHLKSGDLVLVEEPLLPGHGLEFKFTPRLQPEQGPPQLQAQTETVAVR